MKTTRYMFLMLLMTLFGMSVQAQQRNVLQIPDLTTQTGNVPKGTGTNGTCPQKNRPLWDKERKIKW